MQTHLRSHLVGRQALPFPIDGWPVRCNRNQVTAWRNVGHRRGSLPGSPALGLEDAEKQTPPGCEPGRTPLSVGGGGQLPRPAQRGLSARPRGGASHAEALVRRPPLVSEGQMVGRHVCITVTVTGRSCSDSGQQTKGDSSIL